MNRNEHINEATRNELDSLRGTVDTNSELVINHDVSINNLSAQVNAHSERNNDVQKQIDALRREISRVRNPVLFAVDVLKNALSRWWK